MRGSPYLIITLILGMLSACKGEEDKPLDTHGLNPEVVDCSGEVTPSLGWFEQEQTGSWSGDFEFGQTHVVAADETRLAPPVIADRETLTLFTPSAPVPDTSDVRVSAWQGETLLGALAMQAPADLPPVMEQSLTDTPLDPYSTQAWSATLPWSWVAEGVSVRVGVASEDGLEVAEHTLDDLGAPQRFTLTRTKMVLFGDETWDTATVPASTVARDYFGTLPAAELRWVDTSDWILDRIVVDTEGGYQMVHSEEERLKVTTDSNRWNLIKHQFSLRLSAANTGRGLVLNEGWEGDSSPYSFGTSLGLGWVFDAAGNANDVNDAGLAAGWTGWTTLWAYECDNGFIHEVGHSATLEHFVKGVAKVWGVADEYPNDGQSMSTHPWGYDTPRRMFRTWYQVGSNGPVAGPDEGKNGKYDPMNGGESANALTCFPQYTAYHAQWMQRWSQGAPTFAVIDGEAGSWLWNADRHEYEPYEVDPGFQAVIAVDVPTVTLIGTLGGRHDDTRQTYPPVYSPSGNVFAFPDPEDGSLDNTFEGAKWFLDITYADGSHERALIAVGDVNEEDLRVYSLNLDSAKNPVKADLYYSAVAWPAVDVAGATLVHSRAIGVPDADTLRPVLTAGRGAVANAGLTLTQSCTAGADCDTRSVTSTWTLSEGALTFRDRVGDIGGPEECLERGTYSVLNVPITSDAGATATLIVHGQREVHAGGTTVAVPLNDRTRWMEAADQAQAIRLWIPYAENRDLAPASYHVDGVYTLDALLDGDAYAEIPLTVDLTVYDLVDAPMSTDGAWIGPVSQPDSSLYFTVTDPTMGPSSGVWWSDDSEDAVALTVPVIDGATGAWTTLHLDAWKNACDGWWDFHAAQGAETGPCDNFAVLYVNDDNGHLTSGVTYTSPANTPLIVEAMRWHAPEPYTLIEAFPLKVSYTAP